MWLLVTVSCAASIRCNTCLLAEACSVSTIASQTATATARLTACTALCLSAPSMMCSERCCCNSRMVEEQRRQHAAPAAILSCSYGQPTIALPLMQPLCVTLRALRPHSHWQRAAASIKHVPISAWPTIRVASITCAPVRHSPFTMASTPSNSSHHLLESLRTLAPTLSPTAHKGQAGRVVSAATT